MANPWDNDEVVSVTESVSSSPWEMDEVVEGGVVDLPQVNALPPRATDNMSGYERFMAGVGKSIVDAGYGIAQTVAGQATRPVRWGQAAAEAIYPEAARARGISDYLSTPSRRLEEIAAERREIDADLMNTGSGLAGNVTGTVAQLLTPAMLARGTSLAALAAPTSVRGNAIQGAVLGALQPSTSTADSAKQAALGGGFGGAGAGVINVGGSVLSALRNIGSNAGLTSAERRAAEVLARESINPHALNVVESAVPGVRRTFGEATQDPGLMALENTLRAQNRGAFDAIDMQNNAARVRQLEGIAGTDGDMAAAIAARSDVVDDSLATALRQGDEYEVRLAESAESDRLAAESARLSAEAENARLASLGMPGRVPVPSVPESAGVSDELRGIRGFVAELQGSTAARPSVQSAVNDVSKALSRAGDSVSSLYDVRKYIGDLLEGKAGADKSYARAATRELMSIRDMLDDVISSRAPSFSEYLDAYRVASKPINRMEVGREIISRAGSAIPDQLGNPVLTPAATFRATNDLDAIAAKATGFKKAKASEILTPSDLSAIKAIQDDMSRMASRQRSATPGSQTAERLSIGERIGRNSIASRIPGIGGVMEHFERNANEALQEKLAYLMANPTEAKRVMAALPSGERSALRNTLNQLALAGTKGSAVSTN